MAKPKAVIKAEKKVEQLKSKKSLSPEGKAELKSSIKIALRYHIDKNVF